MIFFLMARAILWMCFWQVDHHRYMYVWMFHLLKLFRYNGIYCKDNTWSFQSTIQLAKKPLTCHSSTSHNFQILIMLIHTSCSFIPSLCTYIPCRGWRAKRMDSFCQFIKNIKWVKWNLSKSINSTEIYK